jgi:hypothetical protein
MTAGFVEHIVRRMTDSDDLSAAAPGLGEEVDWMGEIVRINVDGTVKVRLARETEPPPGWGGERYAVVKCEELILFEEDDEDEEDVESIEMMGVEDVDVVSDDEDEWEDASEGTDEEIPQASLDGMSDVESPEEEEDEAMNDVNGLTPDLPSPTAEIPTVPDTIGVPETTASQLDQEKCAGFDILETVPDDHPFKNDVPTQTSPSYLSRIRKEHRILQTSLPGTPALQMPFLWGSC